MNDAERENYRLRVEQATADPATAERITRIMTGIETLVCGRPGTEAATDEPIFLAGMRLTPEELDMHVVATGRDGRDCVYVAFDIDDLDAEPAICVLRPQGENVVVDHSCTLWVAADARRAVIVPLGHETDGCYAFKAGSQLVHAANRPADDLRGGSRRAQARVRRCASSEAADRALGHARRTVATCHGRGMFSMVSTPLAA